MAPNLISVVSRLGVTTQPDQISVHSMTLFVALLCACILVGHLLEENRWVNESITALGIGLVTGMILLLITKGRSSHLFVFSEELFFIYLLPPIIFNAGFVAAGKYWIFRVQVMSNYLLNSSVVALVLFYACFQVKKKQFFRNFMTIVMFGAVGTLISFAIISIGSAQLFKKFDMGVLETMDYLALGAIFSATDSVCALQVLNQEETPLLYSIVFGEGVVNDATAVVLFNAIQRFDLSHFTSSIAVQLLGNFVYLLITSTLLAVAVGLLSAYMIKKLYFGRHSTDREVALMMLMAYLSYMMAEILNLSGILTVFFCGIVMSHYTWHNITESSRVTTKHAFATLSFISELFIFLYVGMDAMDIEKWTVVRKSPGTSIGVSSLLFGLVLVGRAATVFPLSLVSNLTRKSQDEKIGFKQQIIIWWAGLMRGAVSTALAYNKFTMAGHTELRGNAILITSTISIVLFSTVVIGMMTKPLIRWLLSQKHLNSTANPAAPKTLTIPLLVNGHDPESDTGGDNFYVPRPMSLRMLLTTPTNVVHYYWRKFDNAVMRPVFGGRGFTPFIPGSPRKTFFH